MSLGSLLSIFLTPPSLERPYVFEPLAELLVEGRIDHPGVQGRRRGRLQVSALRLDDVGQIRKLKQSGAGD
jgi:hypothetical protein